MGDLSPKNKPRGDIYNGTSSDLNISSKRIHNCKQVIDALQKTGIMCSVVEQESVICKESNCWTEKGCRITLAGLASNKIEKKVWEPLQSRFGLTCAYLHVHGHYRGCILDYIRPSNCPGPNPSN